jgi:hypothetical protein
MPRYVVDCYGPPSELKIKKKDYVEVKGWQNEEKIRAEEITNPAKDGPTCKCGKPQAIEESQVLPKLVTRQGYVIKVTYMPEAVEFEIQTDKKTRALTN